MATTNSSTPEMACQVAAPSLLCALDLHNLAAKIASHLVARAHLVEGDCASVGSVRLFNSTSVMPFTFMKEKLDFLEDKRESKQMLHEGAGIISAAVEKATSHIKVEPAADGGSVVKVESTYKLLPGVEVKDEITEANKSLTDIFKGGEAVVVVIVVIIIVVVLIGVAGDVVIIVVVIFVIVTINF